MWGGGCTAMPACMACQGLRSSTRLSLRNTGAGPGARASRADPEGWPTGPGAGGGGVGGVMAPGPPPLLACHGLGRSAIKRGGRGREGSGGESTASNKCLGLQYT